MLKMLSSFAALSLCGTVILTILPEGGIKRTAGMAIGLLTLMCWIQGVSALFRLDTAVSLPSTILAPTSRSLPDAAAEASAFLSSQWEITP